MNAIGGKSPQRDKLTSLARMPVLAFVADEDTTNVVCRVVPGGRRGVEVREGGIPTALNAVQQGVPPEVLIIDISNAQSPATELSSLTQACGSETTVIALGTKNDVALYRSLVGAGVTDYLVKPVTTQELRRTLLTAGRTHKEATPEARHGRLVAVVGARGGVGGSMVAVSTAWILAEKLEKRVALIDLDMHFGTDALSLDVEPGSGLRNALTSPDRIDSLFIASALVSAGTNLQVLGGEEPIEEDVYIDPDALERLVTETKSNFDVVVVDLPRHLLGAAAAVLPRFDAIAVVTDLSLASLRDTLRIRSGIDRMAPDLKPLIVGNRIGAGGAGQLPVAEFEKGLGGKLDHKIVDDAKAGKATLDGKPLPAVALRSRSGPALQELAIVLGGATEAKAKTSRWFPARKKSA